MAGSRHTGRLLPIFIPDTLSCLLISRLWVCREPYASLKRGCVLWSCLCSPSLKPSSGIWHRDQIKAKKNVKVSKTVRFACGSFCAVAGGVPLHHAMRCHTFPLRTTSFKKMHCEGSAFTPHSGTDWLRFSGWIFSLFWA